MDREGILTRLLTANSKSNPTLDLLKKIILCAHQGWFRVNGLPPDKNYNLASYLFDEERIILDFTRLDPETRNQLTQWLITPYRNQARLDLLSGVATNDYRGFTAEVGLSWWGRITNLLFYRKKSWRWQVAPVEISLEYQLTGLEICEGKQGILIGFNQFLVPPGQEKYQEPDPLQIEPVLNTKRVFITEALVNQLLAIDLNQVDFAAIIKKPHPFSVDVKSYEKRMALMRENREMHRLNHRPSLFSRLFSWLEAFWRLFFKLPTPEASTNTNTDSTLIFRDKNINVFRKEGNDELVVIEKRPELTTQVFCGGGAKIFGHTGAKKALEDAGIPSLNVAGSSAGAIMATLSFLGYQSDQIFKFFQGFKKEYLIHYDIDRRGMSESSALKAGLDYMIITKVNEIIQLFQLNQSDEGRLFLMREVFKEGKITFESLYNLKKRCPTCCLGLNLIVTATNRARRETLYFSYKTHPSMEVSEAVKISASFPVVYKPTIFNGEELIDGGVLTNTPIEAFRGTAASFLESESGDCPSMLAFQFDNGVERTLLDRLVDRVYRENFLLNWIYSLLTGVKDPVSGWEQDRIKIYRMATQVVVIDVGGVSATTFDIEPEQQQILFNNGKQATMDYINARFCGMENDEALYSRFTCMEELVFYCCYRNRLDLFNEFAAMGVLDSEFINDLRDRYFSTPIETKTEIDETILSPGSPLFITSLSEILARKSRALDSEQNMRIFEIIYPIFYKLSPIMFKNPKDADLFEKERHSLNVNKPLACVRELQFIQGPRHIFFDIYISLLKNIKLDSLDLFCLKLKQFMIILTNGPALNDPDFFGQFNLQTEVVDSLLWVFEKGSITEARALCETLRDATRVITTTQPLVIEADSEDEESPAYSP